jgi:tetratricopeptide (TPR) repeat protein
MAGFISKLLEQLQHYNRVVDDYRQAAEQAPDTAMAYVNWGVRLAQSNDTDAALEKFETAANMDPTKADIFANWGIALARLGQLDEAINKFNQAIFLDPTNPDVHGLMGAALVEAGRLDDANNTYAQALEIAPNNDALLVNWGIALARRGDYQLAKKRFEQALTQQRHQPWVTFLWGVVLAEEGDYEGAIEKFKITVRYVPKHGEAMMFWCMCLNRLERYDDAIDVAREALVVLDDNPELYLALAEALLHVGNLEVALANGRHVLMLDEHNPDAYALLAQIDLRRGDTSSARQRIEKALGLCGGKPDTEKTAWAELIPRLKGYMGESYLLDNQPEQALPFLTDALKLAPDNTELLLLWASLVFKVEGASHYKNETYTDTDNTDSNALIADAVSCLFQVAEKEPWNPRLRFLLGSHYLESGEYEKAIASLTDVVSADGKHVDGAIQLALAYCGHHQTADAVRVMRALSRQVADDARVLFYYGHMLFRHGEWRQAAEKYHAALALAPEMMEATVGLAEATLLLGNFAKTKAVLSPLVKTTTNGQTTRAVSILYQWASFGEALKVGDNNKWAQLMDELISSQDSGLADELLQALVDTITQGSVLSQWSDKPLYQLACSRLSPVLGDKLRNVPEAWHQLNSEGLRYAHPILFAVISATVGGVVK